MKGMKSFKAIFSSALAVLLMTLSLIGVPPVNTSWAASTGVIYYVDSSIGNDNYSGKSTGSPWRTLAHVNVSAAIFKPGDQILLKSGGVWNESLNIAFSGDANSQITIGKYGGDTKPLINGGGGNYAIRIVNQQYITVQDIEMTNYNLRNYDDYKTAYYRRSGVWIQAFHNGSMNNIQFKGLNIHDVTGISITGEQFVKSTQGETVNKNSNAAILANAWEWEANVAADKHAYFNNLVIQDSNIHDIKTIGINIDGYQNTPDLFHKNIVIRNNTINKTGSDGIIVGAAENPLIEHNIAYDVGINSVDGKWIAGMWVWKTSGATFQNNEVARVHYQNSASTDSFAFDTDIMTQGDHLYQYNYSHDNSGGFEMDTGSLKNGRDIYRYNISQNDAHHGFSGYTMNISNPGLFYNNVFYNDNGDGYVIKDNPQATFINNIFYTAKGNLPYPRGPKFYNNDFFGSAPPSQGIHNLTLDPKFVNPGHGGDGINTVGGYNLQPNSPMIGAGKVMDNNGGKDFWGNKLYTGSPDIGAFEDPNSTIQDTTAPLKPTELAMTNKTDTTATLSWNATENNVPLDADIYDAATHTVAASVMMSSTCTLTGLTPDTSYTFYIVAKDLSGNLSPQSNPITVKTTIAAIVADNADAIATGAWSAATGSSSYHNDYVSIAAGSGSNSVKWTPLLPNDGYYAVFYWLPDGSARSASNVPFTVYFAGGSQTYPINERSKGGSWVVLGIHKFNAGTTGYVQLTDNANGVVAADAVKFLYQDGFGLDSINKVVLSTDRLQLKLGETMGLSVMGTDANGKALDLISEGFAIQYHSDNPAASVSGNGVITGVSSGTANITATVTVNGKIFTSNSAQVIVGSGLIISTPSFTDSYGNTLTSLSPYGIVQATTTAINSTDSQQSVTLIVAVYNQKGLIKSSLQNVVVNSYDHAALTVMLAMPSDINGCIIKAFVWDGKGTMHPLTTPAMFPK